MIPSASKPAPKLVVADDEEGLLFLMVDGLRREGFEVEGFETGEEVLEWLARESADLLVLDLKLGSLPAPVLVQRLREQGREFPFIVITGHGDERTAVEVMKQGALDYVMKEKGMLELLPAIVRRALAVIARDRELAEANEDIRQREERHRKIIQTALDGFVRFDAQGRFIEVNRAFCDLVGYTAEEILGVGWFAIEATVPLEEIDQRISELKERGYERCLTRLHRRDGSQIEVQLSMRADDEEFFGFVHDVSEQRRLEREVLDISEGERNRIGREMHDGLGQQLTAIELMSHTLARELKPTEPKLSKSADKIAEYTRQTIVQARQLAHGLAPVALENEGLIVALNDLAEMTLAAGVPCEFKSQSAAEFSDSAVATHLYRIAQEAVNNAITHGKAKRIVLRLADHGGRVELSIEDEGKGLPAKQSSKRGMGLKVMHHRASLIGGQLHIHSTKGQGVRIVCSLPKQS